MADLELCLSLPESEFMEFPLWTDAYVYVSTHLYSSIICPWNSIYVQIAMCMYVHTHVSIHHLL